MRSQLLFLALAGVAVSLGVRPGPAQQSPGTAEAAKQAIQKHAEAFVEAFHKGDAKALAAFWAVDGDYTDENGRQFKGRTAIEKAFTELFAEHKGLKLGIDSISLRFVTPDVAIEDGTTAVFAPGGAPALSGSSLSSWACPARSPMPASTRMPKRSISWAGSDFSGVILGFKHSCGLSSRRMSLTSAGHRPKSKRPFRRRWPSTLARERGQRRPGPTAIERQER
jgi:uncharacterized protein (TIGR02246 family)